VRLTRWSKGDGGEARRGRGEEGVAGRAKLDQGEERVGIRRGVCTGRSGMERGGLDVVGGELGGGEGARKGRVDERERKRQDGEEIDAKEGDPSHLWL